MQVVLIIIGALLAVLMAFSIIQNSRRISVLTTKQDDIEQKGIEQAVKLTAINDRLNKSINTFNNNDKTLKNDVEEVKDEIKEIFEKLDGYAKDFGRLDEIDFRAKQASAKASDIARCYVLNEKANVGVEWAERYRCGDDESV